MKTVLTNLKYNSFYSNIYKIELPKIIKKILLKYNFANYKKKS